MAIFLQIGLLMAQIGHKDCGKPKSKRGQVGGSGHSTGQKGTTLEHAWSVAIVLPNVEAEPECDEYGYTDDGFKCDPDGGNGDDYEDYGVEDYGSRTDSIGGGDKPKNKMHCSGSILNENTFITAAHCFVENGQKISVDKIKEMTVIVGANEPLNEKDLKKRRRFVQQVKIHPKKVLIHEKYDMQTKAAYYDVAIVKILGRFKFRPSVWPICIPEESSDEIDEWWQKGLTLAAYGENTKNEVDNDAVLTVETFIGEKSTLCSGLYDVSSFDAESEQISLSLPRLFNDNSVFCARVPGSDAGTCPGDSGGTLLQTPFIEKIKDSRSILRGVVHGSIAPCDGSRFPSIFVRIDNHDILTWIADTVFKKQNLRIKKKKKLSGGTILVTEKPEGSLTDETFEDRECARRATSSVHSPCLEWKSKADTANGPIEESDGGKCIYICNPNDGKWCRVNYEKPLFSGKTKGLCFTNGACFGTPDACVDCKEKCPKSK